MDADASRETLNRGNATGSPNCGSGSHWASQHIDRLAAVTTPAKVAAVLGVPLPAW